MIKKLEEMFQAIEGSKKGVLAVAAAHDEEVLQAIKDASEMGIVEPILVGNKEKIESISKEIGFNLDSVKIFDESDIKKCAEIAVKLVSSNEADFVMKGLLDTSVLLKEVLNKEYGLRTSNLLSHVMIYDVPAYHKLLVLTDGGMCIAPDYNQKVQIIQNAIKATKALGGEDVKVACICAKEKVNEKMPATVDAQMLREACKEGVFGEGVIVEGPIAFDLAVSKQSSEIKGFKSEISGDVDIMLVPTIEVGNGIGKALTYFANSKSAGIIMGAAAPIVLTSRADSHQTKLYSIAYGALVASR
ncbi:MAG: bifunctional enoyl-CoA hydratase/phosphate acetyltransferase [Clostridioides sp.]|nr:bifunctional enoyl-CoA hydratase/phosphate acetyltransferase [Clostridioides sp.]